MLGAIFCFSSMDALAKLLARDLPVIQVVWARYAGQMVVVLLVLAPRVPRLMRTHRLGLQLLRSAFLFAATYLFFTALSRMDLAAATAVMNIHPVILTLGAALFLGEALGPRRVIGICAALLGALIVIRPGSEVFTWTALIPLAAGSCYAAYALATRFLGRDEPILTSFLYTALIGSIAASVLAWPSWQMPSAPQWGLFAMIGAVAALGQYLLIQSLTTAEAGAVAPFGYAGVLFATLFGLLFFGEVPDIWTCFGALVIIGAGVYVWHRETQARAQVQPNHDSP